MHTAPCPPGLGLSGCPDLSVLFPGPQAASPRTHTPRGSSQQPPERARPPTGTAGAGFQPPERPAHGGPARPHPRPPASARGATFPRAPDPARSARSRAHARTVDTQPTRNWPATARPLPPAPAPQSAPARRKFVPRRRGLRGGRIARGEAPRGSKSGESAERSNSRSTRGRKSGRARRRDAARLTVPGGRPSR